MNKDYWLDAATEKIRFSPDRKAVRRELEGHIQDREDAYRARGLEDAQARRQAMDDMGDPYEIAEELGKIHSPWWGRLWKASRWTAVLLVLAAFFQLVPYLVELRDDTFYSPALPEETEVWSYADGLTRTVRRLQAWEPAGSAELKGYRFSVPMAYLQYREPWTGYNGSVYGDSYELTIILKAAAWRFWEPLSASQLMLLDHTATDSEGRLYAWDPDRDPEEVRSLFCETRQNIFTTWFIIELELTDGTAPDWVDLPIGYGGDVLRIDLEKGVTVR